MADKISYLPIEVLLIILSYLPLQSLLAFGATSQVNFQRHLQSIKSLRLAVFSRRVYNLISFIKAGWLNIDSLSSAVGGAVTLENNLGNGQLDYTVPIIRPHDGDSRGDLYDPKIKNQKGRCPKSWKECSRLMESNRSRPPRPFGEMVRVQNDIFAKVLSRYGASLCHLELMAYDLNADGAFALGKFCGSSLCHLALRLEHTQVRDGLGDLNTWSHPAAASTAWNALIGVGPYNQFGQIRNLRTLILERAGITPWQLVKLVKCNPELITLKLRTCNGAQPGFLYWLGGLAGEDDEDHDITLQGRGSNDEKPAPGANLKVFWLENCHHIVPDSLCQIFDHHPDAGKMTADTCDRGLEWVKALKSLEVSSLHTGILYCCTP